MRQNPHTPSKRRPVNLTISSDLMKEVKSLGINASRVVEYGLRQAVEKEKSRRFYEENKEAIEAYNDWVDKNGVLITPAWMRDDGTV